MRLCYSVVPEICTLGGEALWAAPGIPTYLNVLYVLRFGCNLNIQL